MEVKEKDINIIYTKKGAKIQFSERLYEHIFELSGSKAKSVSGKHAAVQRTFNKALRLLLEDLEQKGDPKSFKEK